MAVEDIDRLLSGKQPEQTLNDILRRLIIVDPDTDLARPFDPIEATLGDFFAALVNVRIITHGNKFIFKTTCEECDHTWRHDIDLSDEYFAAKEIKWAEPGDPLSGVDRNTLQFVVKLARPHEGIELLRLRLFQGKHQAALTKIVKTNPEKKMTEQLRIRIVGFEGKIDPATKDKPPANQSLARPSEAWIRSLSIKNAEYIQRQIEEVDGGIQSSIPIPCVSCGHVTEDAPIPFNDKDARFLSSRSAGTRSGER